MRYLMILMVICIQGVYKAGANDNYYTGGQPDLEASPMRYYVGDQIKPFYERAKQNYKHSKRIATLEDMIQESSFWTGQCYQLNAVVVNEYIASDLFQLDIRTVDESNDDQTSLTYYLLLNSEHPHTHRKVHFSYDYSIGYQLSFQRALTGELMESMDFGAFFEMRVHQRKDHTHEIIIYSNNIVVDLSKYCRLWQKSDD